METTLDDSNVRRISLPLLTAPDHLVRVLGKLDGVAKNGRGWIARCPAHNDRNPSLKIDLNSGDAILLHCFAGCATPNIVDALELEMADLFPPAAPAPIPIPAPRKIVATYDYRDGESLLFQVVRYQPKGFAQRRPVAGGWAYNLHGVELILYRIDALRDSRETPVFLCAGEKDADRLAGLGLLSTTNPMGESANKWKPQYTETLAGRDVAILADNDKTGREHAERIATELYPAVRSLRVIALPGLTERGDVSDWLDAGNTIEGLLSVAGATPNWAPDENQPEPPDAAPADFAPTDTGNAERLVARHGEDTRYNWSRGVWHVWTGSHWSEDVDGRMDQLAKDTVRAIPEETVGLAGDAYVKRLKWAGTSEAAGKRAAMVDLARSEPGIPVLADRLDTDPWLLNVRNGTVDLQSGDVLPHRREDLITRCLTIPYTPDAPCPTFLAFLDRIFDGNAELIAYVQRMIGYALTGSIREQAIFIAYGNGSNGKSTLLGTVSAMLETYATEADTDSFLERQSDRIREDVAALEGARFVSASETADGKRLSEAFVKKATGGEKLRARRLFENGYTFAPTCKVWLSTNHRPNIAGTDHAIWRRIRLIPFTVTISDQDRDRDLPNKLQVELPGILAWAIEGCREWLRNGEQPPTTVLEATAQYRRDMDALANWIEDRCDLQRGARTAAKDLYANYVTYCQQSGEEPLKQRTFGTRLTERGFGETRSGSTRFRTGIRIRERKTSLDTSLDGTPSDASEDEIRHESDVSDVSDAISCSFLGQNTFAEDAETYVTNVTYVTNILEEESQEEEEDFWTR